MCAVVFLEFCVFGQKRYDSDDGEVEKRLLKKEEEVKDGQDDRVGASIAFPSVIFAKVSLLSRSRARLQTQDTPK